MTYRDSCDINLQGNKSVIKFYEHWKIKNKGEDSLKLDKTKFNKQNSSPEKSLNSDLQSFKKIKSQCSEDSNCFNIFEAKEGSVSKKSDRLSEMKTSPHKQKNSIDLKIRVKKMNLNETKSLNISDNKSESSTKSNNKSFFRQFSEMSKESKMGNNLLSDFISQTDKKSVTGTALTDNRDSLVFGPLSLLSGNQSTLGRSSAQLKPDKRESKFSVDERIKKKYSMMESKSSPHSRKEKENVDDSDPWKSGEDQNNLMRMLSLHSNITDPLKHANSDVSKLEDLI